MGMKITSDLKDQLTTLLSELGDYDYSTVVSKENPGLFMGDAGLSIFYYNLYLHTQDDIFYEKAFHYFQTAYHKITPHQYNFSMGATGIMWLLNYYKKEDAFEIDYDEYLEQFDITVSKHMADQYDFDPMHGLLGIANYFLNRNTPFANECIIDIINKLDTHKVVTDKGISWLSTDHVNGETVEYVNLGYAHGLIAIGYYLSRFIARGIEKEKCEKMLTGTLNYILSVQDNSKEFRFPSHIDKQGNPSQAQRVCYCYGDLGIACGLTIIAQNTKDDQLLLKAKEAAEYIALVAISNIDKIEDIGLCHGAAGNGYMFMKLYHWHQSSILQQAAIAQYNQLFNLKREGTGIAGYTSIDFDLEKQAFYKKTDPGFITGVAGVGLSIISCLDNEINGEWDEILLLR